MRKIIRTKRKKEIRPCHFCLKNVDPDYKSVADLQLFITTRGKIVGRKRSGVCAKHQRALGREIKRARFLALV
ncbi:MAG: 30S ribosomal protein S18 [candidate division CPR1 bacterium GW2011_GWA2_42_17]|uniref:30S ribosomal protein S18 n=1 Tax=candidate division CPR1 bacterium GW2011_GWA2_42_17 TaxID=1618341 RepID=A0A0G1BUU8_9BACT|nr:MAG: 30S ribosomal protein S18 [candidate division CPR1 bacterium GW2011_GWA2_42_17]